VTSSKSGGGVFEMKFRAWPVVRPVFLLSETDYKYVLTLSGRERVEPMCFL